MLSAFNIFKESQVTSAFSQFIPEVVEQLNEVDNFADELEISHPKLGVAPECEYGDGGSGHALVHAVTWLSLYQALIPYIIFDTYEKAEYESYFGEEKPDGEILTTEHYTKEIEAWKEITYINGIVWGPSFILGIISLSYVLYGVTNFYIEHILSNLYIAAYLYVIYKLFYVAMYMDTTRAWRTFWVVFTSNIITFAMQWSGFGTAAIRYLKQDDYENADNLLLPSIFYLLRWYTHIPACEKQ